MAKEDVSYAAYDSMDGQGKPTYGTAVTIKARVIEVESFVLSSDGTKIPTQLTLYVPPGQDAVPARKGTITLADARVFNVKEVTSPRKIGGARSSNPDHYRLKCSRGR